MKKCHLYLGHACPFSKRKLKNTLFVHILIICFLFCTLLKWNKDRSSSHIIVRFLATLWPYVCFYLQTLEVPLEDLRGVCWCSYYLPSTFTPIFTELPKEEALVIFLHILLNMKSTVGFQNIVNNTLPFETALKNKFWRTKS